MSATKRHSSSRRIDSGHTVAKRVHVRHGSGKETAGEAVRLEAACLPFSEWLSPEDDEAFRDL